MCATVMLLVVAQHGCDALGGPPHVTDVRSGILEAKAIGKAYTLAVGDLARTGVITPDQARTQLEVLRTAALTLKSTNALLDTDPGAAQSRLAEVRTTLQAVLTFLTQFEQTGGRE